MIKEDKLRLHHKWSLEEEEQIQKLLETKDLEKAQIRREERELMVRYLQESALKAIASSLEKSAQLLRDTPNERKIDRPKIKSAPGTTILGWCRLIFTKKFVSKILEPTIHDLQEEYIEALGESRLGYAKWVAVRGYASFGVALFLGVTTGLLKRCFDAWRALNSG